MALLGSDRQEHPSRTDCSQQSMRLSTPSRKLKRLTPSQLTAPNVHQPCNSNYQAERLKTIDHHVESPQPKQNPDSFQMSETTRQTDNQPASPTKRFFYAGHWHYDRVDTQSLNQHNLPENKVQTLPDQPNSRKNKRKEQPDVEDPSSKRRCFFNNDYKSTVTIKHQRSNPYKFPRNRPFKHGFRQPYQN